jgi:hypothetical protein
MSQRSTGWWNLSKRSARRARRLGFQPLEQRALLAGDVAAWVSRGTLFIRGNGAGNGVQIGSFFDEEEQQDVFVVSGFFHEGGETTINGQESDEFRGVQNIDVNLKGGNDTLLMTNDDERLFLCLGEAFGSNGELAFDAGVLTNGVGDEDTIHVPGSVVIATGDGEDEVGVGNVHIGVDLVISTGRHNDRVGLCEVHAGDDIALATGDGDDDLGVALAHAEDAVTIETGKGHSAVGVVDVNAGVLTILGGTGRDFIIIEEAHAARDMVIKTAGNDDDVVVCDTNANNLIIDMGAGHDDVHVGHVRVLNDVVIATGSGHDFVSVSNDPCRRETFPSRAEGEHEAEHDIGDDLVIDTGSGDDDVSLVLEEAALSIGDVLSISTGNGADEVRVFNVEVHGQISVATGSGNDDVIVEVVLGRASATFDMGGGTDRLSVAGMELVDDLFALMGAGNEDLLEIDNCGGRKAVLRGGSGRNDTLLLDTLVFETLDIKEFENT